MYDAVMRLGLTLLVAAGCYSPTPQSGAPCGEGRVCPDGLRCVGDPGTCERTDFTDDAAVDVAIDACNATCSGSDLIACGQTITCTYGCVSTGTAHCAAMVPSNGLDPALLIGATADYTDTAGASFDTEDGEIKKGNIILRPAGTGLIGGIRFEIVDNVGVFAAHSFTQTVGNDWSGGGANPLTLFAATTITITADLDASGGQFGASGPGGSANNSSTTVGTCRGRAGRLISVNKGEGGGGGGGATAGGNGGASSSSGPTGIGGSMCTTPSTIPLRGGWGGGNGGANGSNAGGGGGGAVSLVAMEQITVMNGAAVAAPGGGGVVLTNGEGGGGGGGGGAVFLEAPKVVLRGAVTAGGGGGAAPTNTDGSNGAFASTAAAAGGSYTGPGGTARGGNGGALTTPPGVGQNYFYDDGLGTVISRGGGGGGSVGRIEVRARVRDLSPSLQNPVAAQSDVVMQ